MFERSCCAGCARCWAWRRSSPMRSCASITGARSPRQTYSHGVVAGCPNDALAATRSVFATGVGAVPSGTRQLCDPATSLLTWMSLMRCWPSNRRRAMLRSAVVGRGACCYRQPLRITIALFSLWRHPNSSSVGRRRRVSTRNRSGLPTLREAAYRVRSLIVLVRGRALQSLSSIDRAGPCRCLRAHWCGGLSPALADSWQFLAEFLVETGQESPSRCALPHHGRRALFPILAMSGPCRTPGEYLLFSPTALRPFSSCSSCLGMSPAS